MPVKGLYRPRKGFSKDRHTDGDREGEAQAHVPNKGTDGGRGTRAGRGTETQTGTGKDFLFRSLSLSLSINDHIRSRCKSQKRIAKVLNKF